MPAKNWIRSLKHALCENSVRKSRWCRIRSAARTHSLLCWNGRDGDGPCTGCEFLVRRERPSRALHYTEGHDCLACGARRSCQKYHVAESSTDRTHGFSADFDEEVNKLAENEVAVGSGFAEICAQQRFEKRNI